MLRLLWEDLKLYRMIFLLSVSLSLALIFIVQVLKIEIPSFILMMTIFIPEFKRYNEISNNGYFALINKLPITKNEIYFIKFISSISGVFIYLLPFCIVDIFYSFNKDLFYYSNITNSNIMIGLIINNHTNLFSKNFEMKNMFHFFGLFIGLFINLSIYNWVFSDLVVNLLNNHFGLVYLLCLFIQFAFTFLFGKIYYYFAEKRHLSQNANINQLNF